MRIGRAGTRGVRKTLWQVLSRQKDIQYASRGRRHVARQEQIHRLRHVIRELGERCPSAQRPRGAGADRVWL
jgi:hypothetical protein